MKIIRAMTFNIRFDNPADGEKRWENRKKATSYIIKKYHPTIVGIQEATWRQIRDLKDMLPDYTFCTKGRVWDDTCQYPTLIFKTEELRSLDNSEFWLSSTPSVHRSKDWGSAFPRMLSFAKFTMKEIETPLIAAVTHLDNKSPKARRKQAELIVNWHNENDLPSILMGDFNETPEGEVHSLFTSASFVDTWKELGFPEDETSLTHHDFNGNPDKGRLDWILVTSHFMVLNGEIVKDSVDDIYPSDHFPYYVDLALKEGV